MPEKSVKRKLTAILCADVKGYSRMMGKDEVGTFHTLSAYLEIMKTIISAHRGRVFSSPGDAVLAQFASVVDAVECAVEIQEKIEAKNAGIPDDRKMRFRIGVNLGDVIEKGEQIYGDGVNIAARIETLSDAGGVSISRTVYNHVYNKLNFGYEFQGEHPVKNITKPIRVYKVLTAPEHAGQLIGETKTPKFLSKKPVVAILAVLSIVVASIIWHFYPRAPAVEPASVENMAFPLPEKPSIAVLPFTNLSGDSTQDYIADGISENIISDMSKIADMFVIASNSTFTYKGKPVKVQQVSEELGVRYVLEGSTHKIDNRIRITVQLIDAITGRHLWSEKFDRVMEDFFDLQDEITQKIIIELQVKLTEGEQARISHKSTTNLEAWSYAVRGLQLFEQVSKENNAKAMVLFKRAVKLDPGYVWAWVRLAWTHIQAMGRGWSHSPLETSKRAAEISQKVLRLYDSDSDVRALTGFVYRIQDKYNKAIAEGEKALTLEPTNAQAHVLLAVTMNALGRFDEAAKLVEKAMRIHPYYPAYYLTWLGTAYRMSGRYDEALPIYRSLLERSKKGEFPIIEAHLFLAEVYSEMSKAKEAESHAEEILKLNPEFSIQDVRNTTSYRFKDSTHLEHRLNALRKAGIPEHPPLPIPEKPSIAVLAFDNFSGDPEQEYFSDGISEEIINALSKTDRLFVIARNSSFTYKGKSANVKQISRELGVRYVLEGSVRKSGDRVRVTAQLVDATTGHHLWSERFDRELKEIFAIQDEITMKIVTALQIKLTEGEQARLWAKKSKNLALFLKYMEAQSLWNKGTRESYIRFGQVGQEIVDMAPESQLGYYVLAWYNWIVAVVGKSPEESIVKAFKHAQKALSMDESDALSHALMGSIYLSMRQYGKAIAAGERSIALLPNSSLAHEVLGETLCYTGKIDEGINQIKQGIRLNPFPAYWYFHGLGRCYTLKGHYEEALTAYKKALQCNPDALISHVGVAQIYILMDRTEEARAAAKKVLELDPKFSVERISKGLPYKNPNDLKLFVDALYKAGLK